MASAGLRHAVVRGVAWKLLSASVGQGSQSLVAVLLAHLLAPHDFGVVAMALTFSGLTAVFGDIALSAALIQRPSLSEDDRSTAFWTQLVAGLVWTALGILLSPLVADLFHRPQVAPLFIALCCSGFVITLGQTQNALLTRAMSFRRLELRRVASALVGAVAAVAVALTGFGPWAIVAQVLGTNITSTTLVWILSPWRPRWMFSRMSLRVLGTFGVKTLGGRLLLYANQNADNLLVGRYLGSGPLGIYTIAYNVMTLPMARVTAPIRDVFYAAFARLQDDPERLGDVWLRVNRLAAALLVPGFLGLAAVAPDLVTVVLGHRWQAAVPVLQLLSLAGAAESYQAFHEDVYQALGQPGQFLAFMISSSVLTVGGFAVGLQWGIVGVAASYAIARTTALAINTTWMCSRIKLSLTHTFRTHLQATLAAIAMAAAVYGTRELLAEHHVNAALRLAFCCVLGIALYAMAIYWRSPELIAEIRSLPHPHLPRWSRRPDWSPGRQAESRRRRPAQIGRHPAVAEEFGRTPGGHLNRRRRP